jgi:predicted AlkP superfamily pyrophosphatase or phosphodiesterase
MRMLRGWLLILGLLLAAGPGCASAPAARPIVIVVAFDGWRWDYLDTMDAPALSALAARGVRADGLIPVHPTLTFPNHYTLVTGLRPARHGIVSNTMVDPALPGRFTLSNTAVTSNPAWWSGEPIWRTASRQGLKSATMFWPGSDVAIGGHFPTYWRQFEDALPPAQRTDQVLEWLRLPEAERPSVLTVYYSDLDTAGHDAGPGSPAVRIAAARVDHELGRLARGVEELGLQPRVHWIVVSDHGMAQLAGDRVIVLDDLIDVAAVDVLETGSMLTLNPKGGAVAGVEAALRGRHPHLRVFRSSDLPPAYGLAGHPRVPAIVGLADEGWTVMTRERLAARNPQRVWGGAHGFDPAFKSMQGLFVAAGPRLRSGERVPAFENVHVYELMCELLGISPAPNDGDPTLARGWLR